MLHSKKNPYAQRKNSESLMDLSNTSYFKQLFTHVSAGGKTLLKKSMNMTHSHGKN